MSLEIASLFHSGVLYLGASTFFALVCVYSMKLLIDIRTQLRNLNIRAEHAIDELEVVNCNLIDIADRDTK